MGSCEKSHVNQLRATGWCSAIVHLIAGYPVGGGICLSAIGVLGCFVLGFAER